jgi:hypothetical protein
VKLKCGHPSKVYCGLKTENSLSGIKCKKKCTKLLKCGHPCRKKCFELCHSLSATQKMNGYHIPCEHKIESAESFEFHNLRICGKTYHPSG